MALGDVNPPPIDLTNLPVFSPPGDLSNMVPPISDTLTMPVPVLPPPTVATLPTTPAPSSSSSSYVWIIAGLGVLYLLGAM